jgi:hypothetical protein
VIGVIATETNDEDPLGGVAEGVAGSVVATTGDPSRRDVTLAEADARIRDEYLEFLESELARTQADLDETNAAFVRLIASFDEKERYIDSLLSVRVKKWIVGRLPNRES